jgi:hypothetical protein
MAKMGNQTWVTAQFLATETRFRHRLLLTQSPHRNLQQLNNYLAFRHAVYYSK